MLKEIIKKISKLFLVIFCIFFTIEKSYASDDLKNFLLKFTDFQNYPWELLSNEFKAYYRITGIDEPLIFDKNQLKEFYDEQNQVVENYRVENLKVLDFYESDNFINVTYQYDWYASLGNTDMNGILSSHILIEKSNTGWIVIFEAVNQ